MTTSLSAALCCAIFAAAPAAHAFEGTWHVGPDVGYSVAGFAARSVTGFGSGAHVAYGINDAFNLRAHGDVMVFELPAPATSALISGGALGVEYTFDTLDWLLYGGVLVGVYNVSYQAGGEVDDPEYVPLFPAGIDVQTPSVEVPVGLSYRLHANWSVGAEAQFRWYLAGGDAPLTNLFMLGRASFLFGH